MVTPKKSNSNIYNMGFSQTSGDISELKTLASKMIYSPVMNERQRNFNKLVNWLVSTKNIEGLKNLNFLNSIK